jgi:hypothetical protein
MRRPRGLGNTGLAGEARQSPNQPFASRSRPTARIESAERREKAPRQHVSQRSSTLT